MVRDTALDNPVRQQEEDEFNRWPFSKRLADTIAGLGASEGAPVLGLFGKWGYGKSTVLNFVRTVLEKDYAERVTVFAFNPWLFRDPDTLLLEFFRGLADSIDLVLDKRTAAVGGLMTRYSGALSAVPFVGAGLSKAVEAAGKDLSSDTAHAQRERLIQAMLEANRKVVVLIDDIDRLDRDEIMTMLKVVRLSANFPNVIYLLAFDEERVGRVAGQAYGSQTDGRQFIEKIIQYPFSLPTVSNYRLANYVVRQATAACEVSGVRLSAADWEQFHKVCTDTLLTQLTTPRQAIRYANALRFALPMLRNDVDPYSQMLVEAARILFPDVYDLLRLKPDLREEDLDRIARLPVSHLEEVPSTEKLKARELANEIFFSAVFRTNYHERYFTYAIPPEEIPLDRLRDLYDQCNQPTAASGQIGYLVGALAENRQSLFINLISSTSSDLNSTQTGNLASGLEYYKNRLPQDWCAERQELERLVNSLRMK